MSVTTNSTWYGPPLSAESMLETMRRFALVAPKRETWLSTRQYPGAGSVRIEASGENFIVAHPSFWLRVEHHCRADTLAPPNLLGNPVPFMGIPIIEIDPSENDTPERRDHILDLWRRLKEAVGVASVSLPDWLKSAPKFTRHG